MTADAASRGLGRRETPIRKNLEQNKKLQPNRTLQPSKKMEARKTLDPQQLKRKALLEVRVWPLPPGTDKLKEIYNLLSPYGNISFIRFIKDSLTPIVIFSPAPVSLDWEIPIPTHDGSQEKQVMRLTLCDDRFGLVQSPINFQVSYPRQLTLRASIIHFGFMHSETSLMAMHSVRPHDNLSLELCADLFFQRLVVKFPLQLSLTDTRQMSFRVPFRLVREIHEIQLDGGKWTWVFCLESPPEYHMRKTNVEETFSRKDSWDETKAWDRVTDVTHSEEAISFEPISFRNPSPILDCGRWLSFYIGFEDSKNQPNICSQIRQAIKDWNIHLTPTNASKFQIRPKHDCTIWQHIDASENPVTGNDNISHLQEMTSGIQLLSFPLRYQLEVCLSRNYLHEYNLTKDFLEKLGSEHPEIARMRLEQVANDRVRVYNPMEIFKKHVDGSKVMKPVPQHCIAAYSCIVTPTTIHFSTPAIDTSNRVVRQYSEYKDRFLRVRFFDELPLGRLSGRSIFPQEEVFKRVSRALENGIKLGDRHYEFLAFGSSQFREHGAYFFASPHPGLTAKHIRAQLGNLSDIRIPAKCCARLGQNFSTTRAIRTLVNVKDCLSDIEHNGFCFTDGVGKISDFLARMIANQFRTPDEIDEPPSVFQFRLGGCKGVLAMDPELSGPEIHIRPSQYKFPAKHHGLEIIRMSQFSSATLNRQLISLLSVRGVTDGVFRNLMAKMLEGLETAMNDKEVALDLLQKFVDFNQSTLRLAQMVCSGFMDSKEPFFMSMLQLWRSWTVKLLKEKAKIFISDGAHILGCVDEYNVLRGYYTAKVPFEEMTVDERIENLPEIFVKIDPLRTGESRVVEGLCILARNPSLHPGDIRVVKAVNKPELQHLKNVVVLPQNGDRDLGSMCSGGDLDGDDYFVAWNPDLVPAKWDVEAMDFAPVTPNTVNRDVTVEDMTEFFVQYIKNDNLPTIANSHLSHADRLPKGAFHETCTCKAKAIAVLTCFIGIKLAKLHSHAVDYPKSGIPAVMKPELASKIWPHFMEKTHLERRKTYHSKNILGQLFDMVERVDFNPERSKSFDERILLAHKPDLELLEAARKLKGEYDAALKRIMAQHDIKTEFEVWGAFVLNHNMEKRDYSFAEEVGKLWLAMREHYRKLCIEAAGGQDRLTPFLVAMYMVTAESSSEPDGMISFPWLFDQELGTIAIGSDARRHSQAQALPQERRRHNIKQLPAAEENVMTGAGELAAGDVLELFGDAEIVEKPATDGIDPSGQYQDMVVVFSDNDGTLLQELQEICNE
jgi:RNA-dependent RNA polymerase